MPAGGDRRGQALDFQLDGRQFRSIATVRSALTLDQEPARPLTQDPVGAGL
jgi:hypothetical protein